VKFTPPKRLYDEEFMLLTNKSENKIWTVYSLQYGPETMQSKPTTLRRSTHIAERQATKQLDQPAKMQNDSDQLVDKSANDLVTDNLDDTTFKNLETENKTTNGIFEEVQKVDFSNDQSNIQNTAEKFIL